MPLTRRRTLLAALLAPPLAACSGIAPSTPTSVAAPARDWFIFLETGLPTPDDRDAVIKMQRGHIDNFKRLFGEGKLFAAGPMRDPSGIKRGIVVVRAGSLDELRSYFTPDDYVRLGYMKLNAVPARAHKPLNHEGIDANSIEEVRIVQIARAEAANARGTPLLAGLVERGTLGAWYTLDSGPVAEVLFARSTDSAALEAALAPYGAPVTVWSQWLGKGVVR